MEVTDKKSSNSSRTVFGLILVFISLLLLVDNFGFYPIHWHRYIFTWPTFLIFIGLIVLSNSRSRITGLVMITIGAFFLAARFFYIPVFFGKLFWPVVILAVGLSFLFSSGRSRHIRPSLRDNSEGINDDLIDDFTVLGGSETKITSQNLLGGKITSILGGSTINLSNAQLAPGSNVIDLLCLMGEIVLIIPPEWNVRIEAVSILGGVTDNRNRAVNSGTSHELVIKGVILMGGLEIKSPTF